MAFVRARWTPVLLAALLLSPLAPAQEYPVKPVRVLIPWPPGGSNDIVGRLVFGKLAELLNQQFVIDNRGGASGMIGAELVARSPADGYTVMVHSATHVSIPHMVKKVPYDTLGDFSPVTTLAVQVAVLVVHPSLPVRSVKELIVLAKARPGEIAYASSGTGSFVHLTAALLASMTGINVIHVPYKGGGPAGIGLLSGEAQMMSATIGSVLPYIQSNRLRPLGVTSPARVRQFPDWPAIGESIPGYDFTAWIGAFFPANTPRTLVDRLNAELKRALASPDLAEKLSSQSLDPMHATPEEFGQILRKDYDRIGRIIQAANARGG